MLLNRSPASWSVRFFPAFSSTCSINSSIHVHLALWNNIPVSIFLFLIDFSGAMAWQPGKSEADRLGVLAFTLMERCASSA
jgi:hypothetical protein